MYKRYIHVSISHFVLFFIYCGFVHPFLRLKIIDKIRLVDFYQLIKKIIRQ